MSKVEVIPVKTAVLTEQDNIIDVINKYTANLVNKGDIICIAESVVAITQHRFTRPEELHISWQARLLRRFVPPEGSMSSLYGMQAAMNIEGKWKVLFSFLIGGIAKVCGKRGVWYSLCPQAALIDDVTGTMPPFDKCIVFGPKNPTKVANQIAQQIDCKGVCIADVNDLKRACIVGYSQGIDPTHMVALLRNNPFGNDSQTTPIVIIKNDISKTQI